MSSRAMPIWQVILCLHLTARSFAHREHISRLRSPGVMRCPDNKPLEAKVEPSATLAGIALFEWRCAAGRPAFAAAEPVL